MNFVDLHCDSIWTVYGGKQRLRDASGQLNFNRMKEANYCLQTFAMFVGLNGTDRPCKMGLEMIETYYDELKRNQDIILPVFAWKDIEENRKNGMMSALLSLEEGEICEGNIDNLRMFYDKGVRMMTFTWNFVNSLGHPNHVRTSDFGLPELQKGLTTKGVEFLQEMERLGIIVDVSHLGDKGFYDVYEHAKKPFIASHSNARSVCPHMRNLTDDMLRKIGERGGVAGLNFCAEFVDPKGELGGNPFASIEHLVTHVKHMTNVAGMESVSLGTDYDGIDRTVEIENCSQMPRLAYALQKAGFTQRQVDGILGENALRVFKEVL